MTDDPQGSLDSLPDIRLKPTFSPFLLKLFPAATSIVGFLIPHHLVSSLYTETLADILVFPLHMIAAVIGPFLGLAFGCRVFDTWNTLNRRQLSNVEHALILGVGVLGCAVGMGLSYLIEWDGLNSTSVMGELRPYVTPLTWIGFPMLGALWAGWEAYKRILRSPFPKVRS